MDRQRLRRNAVSKSGDIKLSRSSVETIINLLKDTNKLQGIDHQQTLKSRPVVEKRSLTKRKHKEELYNNQDNYQDETSSVNTENQDQSDSSDNYSVELDSDELDSDELDSDEIDNDEIKNRGNLKDYSNHKSNQAKGVVAKSVTYSRSKTQPSSSSPSSLHQQQKPVDKHQIDKHQVDKPPRALSPFQKPKIVKNGTLLKFMNDDRSKPVRNMFSRIDVQRKIFEHLRNKGLQDPQNPTFYTLDNTLLSLFKINSGGKTIQITVPEVSRYLSDCFN